MARGRALLGPWWADASGRAVRYANAFASLHCMSTYLLTLTVCTGPSMLPTFNAAGDLVLIDRVAPRLNRLSPGDVVVARSPWNPTDVLLKRLLAKEGDRILVEPRGQAPRRITIPKGHVWLQGDNKLNSTDSRDYGPVPYALIDGRVMLRRLQVLHACHQKGEPHGPGLKLGVGSILKMFVALRQASGPLARQRVHGHWQRGRFLPLIASSLLPRWMDFGGRTMLVAEFGCH
eukprot:jgi/Chlat1/900/Chrsp107S01348